MSYHTFWVFCFTCLHKHTVVLVKPFNACSAARKFSNSFFPSPSFFVPSRKLSSQRRTLSCEASQIKEKKGTEKSKVEKKKSKTLSGKVRMNLKVVAPVEETTRERKRNR